MRSLRTLAAFVALSALSATAAYAQAPAKDSVPLKEETPGLLAKTKVSRAAAEKAALAKVPNGQIQEAEVEQEHGKLVYSFDIKVPGKEGVEEVQVDAQTGAVVSTEHESPSSEAKEHKGYPAKQPK